ncbi:MAG: MBL fold metallo-hydrolase [Bacillota bacterium]
MKLMQISNHSYYLKNSTNIGIFMLNDKDCLLVDTSYPGNKGKKLLKYLKEEKLNVKYIINTHGHIDHFGANELLAKNFSLQVFASPYEAAFISYPDLSHSFLTSAKPFPKLQTGLKGMEVNKITENNIILDEFNFEIIDLPGHSKGHIGVVSEDKVLYAGDALMGKEVVEEIKLPYFYDIELFKKSLNKIKRLVGKGKITSILPAHGSLIRDDYKKIIDKNIAKVNHLLNSLLEILGESPLSLEKIIIEFSNSLNIKSGIPNHFITRACIMAFLSYLIENNKVETVIKDGLLQYKII